MHRLAACCARFPRATLAGIALLGVLAADVVMRLELVAGEETVLGAEDPVYRRFERFLARFGGGYPLLIAWECGEAAACDDVFSETSLRMAHAVASELEQLELVTRVSSLATSPLLVAGAAGELEARSFVQDGVPVHDVELVRRALSDPLWSRTLVSEDGSAGAIVVELTSARSAAAVALDREIRRALAPYERAGFHFHRMGAALTNLALTEAALTSAIRVSLLTGASLFVALLALIRSWHAVAASLASVGAAALFSLASLPLLGWPLTNLASAAATLVLVIGSADCIHFVSRYLELLPAAASRECALVAAARAVEAPCVLTTLTTALAFLCFGVGGVESLIHFGVLAALGVGLALLLAFSLLPALLALAPATLRSRAFSSVWQAALARLSAFAVSRRRAVLGASAVLALLGALGLPKLRVDLDLVQLLGAGSELARAADFVSGHLQQPERFEIELALPEAARLREPQTLARVARLEDALGATPGVVSTRSILTLLRHADGLLRGGTSPGLPASEAAVGELLELVALGDAGALDAWLTLDQRRLRIAVEARRLRAEERGNALAQMRAAAARILPGDWGFEITGAPTILDRLIGQVAGGQSAVVTASSLLVFALLAAYLRSIPLALLALVPNAAALIALFGAMGHLGWPFTLGCAVVAPVAIGLATDDSIHFLTHYGAEKKAGSSPVEAIRRAIATVGESVIATSLALALGFLAMLSSPLPSVRDVGLLSALAILGGGVADLVVLPALIAMGSPRAPGASARSGRARRAA